MFLSKVQHAPSASNPGVAQVALSVVWEDRKYGQLALPAGYLLTDPETVPMVEYLIPSLDPPQDSLTARAFHHFAYRGGLGFTKDKADAFLRDALIASGLSADAAAAFYKAVHEYGGGIFDHAPLLSASSFDTPEQWQDYQDSRLKITPAKPADDAAEAPTDSSDQPETQAASPAQ
jgi:hypothetical protein